ncbi:MAG: hypothetical protein ACI35P_08960 [Bacillus sp. (in: firmicutes)]
MCEESDEIGFFSLDVDNRKMCEVLNDMLQRGDRIQVYEGAQQINKTGAFIKCGPDFFLWRDGDGNIRFQYLGGAIGILKLNNDYDESRGEHPTPDYNESSNEWPTPDYNESSNEWPTPDYNESSNEWPTPDYNESLND